MEASRRSPWQIKMSTMNLKKAIQAFNQELTFVTQLEAKLQQIYANFESVECPNDDSGEATHQARAKVAKLLAKVEEKKKLVYDVKYYTQEIDRVVLAQEVFRRRLMRMSFKKILRAPENAEARKRFRVQQV